MAPLSEFQQKRAAENILERLALQEDLNNVKERLDGIFNDPSVGVAESTSKQELEELIVEIKRGTATNHKIARFLELASKLGIS